MKDFEKKPADLHSMVLSLRPRLKGLKICLSRSWGGLEKIAAQDFLDLQRSDLSFRLLCLEGSPIHDELKQHAAGSLVGLPFVPGNYFDVRMRKVLRELITEEGINLIHTHQTSFLGSVVPWLMNFRKVALVTSRHIMSGHSKKDLFHALIYRRIDAYIVMSEALKENVLDTHPISARRVRLIRYGLDFSLYDPRSTDGSKLRKEWGCENGIAVGLVGRIDPAKGQATFIRAAAGLLKDRPVEAPPLRFIIVGEETRGRKSGYLESLQELAQEFRISENIVFAGFKDDIPAVMRSFDIAVMPSRQEAFGLVAIEAMAMERPVIISRGGSAEEIVGNTEDRGLLVRPDDAFDLQKQLRRLIDSQQLCQEMGQNGRSHVMRFHGRETRLVKTLEVYDRSLKRRGNAFPDFF